MDEQAKEIAMAGLRRRVGPFDGPRDRRALGAERRARAIWMRVMEGRTYREIGQDLGVSVGWAAQIAKAGMSQLRRGAWARPVPRDIPDKILVAVHGSQEDLDRTYARYGLEDGT